MKFVIVFIIFFVVGLFGVILYQIFKVHPEKAITQVINTIQKPTFSVDDAPSESVKGIIKEMNGLIFWQSRIATEEAQINTPVTLQQGETIRTGETGSLMVEFPDEASIKINPKTQIDFVQTLPVNFVTSIASGSAEFTKLKDVPVTVRAMHLLIRQNSGELSIGVDTDNSLVNLNIISGSVTVAYNDRNLESHEADFESGKRITFDDLTRSFD